MRFYTDILRDHRRGKLVERLTKDLARVIAAVDDTGQKGSIALTLTISPAKGDEGTYEIAPTIKLNIPEAPLPKGTFFADGTGSLVLEPPKGGALFDAAERDSERGERRSDHQPDRALRSVG